MDWQLLFYGTMSLITGIPMMLFPAQKRQAASEAWKTRLAEIEAGEPEYFFEERRSLQAYPPYKTDKKWRIVGILLTVGGAVMVAPSLFHLLPL